MECVTAAGFESVLSVFVSVCLSACQDVEEKEWRSISPFRKDGRPTEKELSRQVLEGASDTKSQIDRQVIERYPHCGLPGHSVGL